MDTTNKPARRLKERLACALLCAALFFCVSARGARAADLGPNTQTFLVDSGYDFSGRSSVEAILLWESENAYFYFEKAYYDDLTSGQQASLASQLRTLGEEFDGVVYPETRKVFGEEWNPGIDGDSRMAILFDKMQSNVGGYFNPNDEYRRDVVVDGRSNENEIIYLNPDFLKSGKVEGFLSHEFQHMIYWNEKTRLRGVLDETWINEGRSELASSLVDDLLGRSLKEQTLTARKRDFLLNHDDSIMDWNNGTVDYASANIFMEYLKDHFGTGLFSSMNRTRAIGAAGLDAVLTADDSITLGGAFTNWTIANYVNDLNFDIRYGYENPHLKTGFSVEPELIYDKNNDGKINLTSSLRNWSAGYYEVSVDNLNAGSTFVRISFTGDDAGSFMLPYIINYRDGHREAGSITLNAKQDGIKTLGFSAGTADSIVLMPSSQKMEAVGDDGSVKSYAFDLVVESVSPESLLHPDGTLVRQDGDEKIYLLEGGRKRWIADSTSFIVGGYDWDKVVVIDAAEMNIYPRGEDIRIKVALHPDGSLIQGGGDRVYLLEGGQKCWITDAATFLASGYDWNKIVKVTAQELAAYPDGVNLTRVLYPEGTLIRGSDYRVYLLSGGKKCWITSPVAFARNRYSWTGIVRVTDVTVASYSNGADIR